MNIIPYYINLDFRLDRKFLLEREFAKMNIKPVRFPAILHKDGLTGCLMSHIKVLESCEVDSDILWVCEDDVEFLVDRPSLDKYIKLFLDSSADILCLGYNSRNNKPYSDGLLRTRDTQTTSSYIIKKNFRKVLVSFWKELLLCIESGKTHPLEKLYIKLDIHKGPFYALDQGWKVLQQNYIFVIPDQRVLIQRPGFSDILNKSVNYKC